MESRIRSDQRVIHPLSGIAPLPQFELWSISPTQISVDHDVDMEARPLSTLSSTQPIEFNVTSAEDEYINLSETYLYIKARATLAKDDKKDPTSEEWKTLQPAQYFMHALFSQIEVKIGDKEITNAPQTYPYRAYLEALLGYSSDAKKTTLGAALWNDTKVDRIESIRPETGGGATGKWFEMMGRLHLDLTFQEKNILGGCDLKIRLIPNTPKFYFSSATAASKQVSSLVK